jgi:hypothetical protein
MTERSSRTQSQEEAAAAAAAISEMMEKVWSDSETGPFLDAAPPEPVA